MNYKNETVVFCDQQLSPNWYRFSSSAGNNMPLTPPLTYRCGTEAPGWLVGTLPKINYQTVTRQACFHSDDDKCKWDTQVNVTKCNSFNVYYLPRPPSCNLRYCGDKMLERK